METEKFRSVNKNKTQRLYLPGHEGSRRHNTGSPLHVLTSFNLEICTYIAISKVLTSSVWISFLLDWSCG